ncbi:hypothetical protein CDCA_CDCA08G2541 [Cyanidium caldarium]|uniref:J domain-containing protein n=1 Tax=Cyanidium caldarium TaxID=2771 RepID=A0AAV9IWS0_CYACA|nr:hypothetical protein CDCA_CDCA08G2541 [Cyanidium caldarium]
MNGPSEEDGEGHRARLGAADDALPPNHYYAVLNVPPTASREEIRAAYLRLSQAYHPDRHTDDEAKRAATDLFTEIKDAYEVLSHPLRREVYDAYGADGLRALESTQLATFDEARAHFEKQRRYKEGGAGAFGEDGWRDAFVDGVPVGAPDSYLSMGHSVNVAVDGTGLAQLLPDLANGDWRYVGSAMAVRGAVLGTQGTLYLSAKDSVSVQYDVTTGGRSTDGDHGGGWPAAAANGVNVTARRQFSSNMVGEVGLAWLATTTSGAVRRGEGGGASFIPLPVLTGKIWRRTGAYATLSLEASYSATRQEGLMLVLTHARQLTDQWQGQLSWAAGLAPGCMATFVRGDDKWAVSLGASIGMGATGVKVTLRRAIDFLKDTHARLRAQLTFAGWALEMGVAREFSLDGILAAAVQIAHAGVSLKLKVGRGNHRLGVPILLVPHADPMAFAVLTGSLGALVAGTDRLLLRPMRQAARERDHRRHREARLGVLAERRRKAQQALELLRGAAERSRQQEREHGGLVIVRAVYGDAEAVAGLDAASIATLAVDELEGVCDVTDALQVMVEHHDSSLRVHGSISKASLNGFYDPTLHDGERVLRVWYTHRGRALDVTVGDLEPLVLGGTSANGMNARTV